MTIYSDKSIINTIKSATTNIESIKSLQYINGDSFLNYTTKSSSSYDHMITVNTADSQCFRVTFTPGDINNYALVFFNPIFAIDNSDVINHAQVANDVYGAEVVFEAPTKNSQSWIINLSNLNYDSNNHIISHNFYFKFFFSASCQGSFSVQNI